MGDTDVVTNCKPHGSELTGKRNFCALSTSNNSHVTCPSFQCRKQKINLRSKLYEPPGWVGTGVPEESYRLWCVVVCDLEKSRMGASYFYDISRLRVKYKPTSLFSHHKIPLTVKNVHMRDKRTRHWRNYQHLPVTSNL